MQLAIQLAKCTPWRATSAGYTLVFAMADSAISRFEAAPRAAPVEQTRPQAESVRGAPRCPFPDQLSTDNIRLPPFSRAPFVLPFSSRKVASRLVFAQGKRLLEILWIFPNQITGNDFRQLIRLFSILKVELEAGMARNMLSRRLKGELFRHFLRT
jgi:hypothetical protein